MNPVDAKYLLREIEAVKFSKSKWEEKFLASIEEQITRGEFLTPGQSTKLQEIYRKVFSNGNHQARAYV